MLEGSVRKSGDQLRITAQLVKTADGYHLWSRQYDQVYIIPPSITKSNRGRFGSSRKRTDKSDAILLADILRTDRGRLQPWHPDSLLTRQIRAKVSLCTFVTRNIVRTSNRLRAILLRYYPAALSVFSSQ